MGGKWKESHVDHGQCETHGVVSSATVDSVMLVSLWAVHSLGSIYEYIISFIEKFCTFSNISTSFWRWGSQSGAAYSKCGLMSDWHQVLQVATEKLATLYQPATCFDVACKYSGDAKIWQLWGVTKARARAVRKISRSRPPQRLRPLARARSRHDSRRLR